MAPANINTVIMVQQKRQGSTERPRPRAEGVADISDGGPAGSAPGRSPVGPGSIRGPCLVLVGVSFSQL